MSTHRAMLRRLCAPVAAAALTAILFAGLSGCQKPPEPPAKERPLPVNTAQAGGQPAQGGSVPANSAPLRPGPGETASSTLVKKDEAPPYVKVKRDKDGRYTWDISGKDVDEIIRTDRQLRRSLGDGGDGKSGRE
ncbi:MAG: hypothetical protein HZA22_01450 [Nitrospirae bacterium]|nr:hypothetical protein [Nitrospirota bacterium]MBI5696119.1 hypothetical protein [Nitrospirota bacterium]